MAATLAARRAARRAADGARVARSRSAGPRQPRPLVRHEQRLVFSRQPADREVEQLRVSAHEQASLVALHAPEDLLGTILGRVARQLGLKIANRLLSASAQRALALGVAARPGNVG